MHCNNRIMTLISSSIDTLVQEASKIIAKAPDSPQPAIFPNTQLWSEALAPLSPQGVPAVQGRRLVGASLGLCNRPWPASDDAHCLAVIRFPQHNTTLNINPFVICFTIFVTLFPSVSLMCGTSCTQSRPGVATCVSSGSSL